MRKRPFPTLLAHVPLQHQSKLAEPVTSDYSSVCISPLQRVYSTFITDSSKQNRNSLIETH